MNLSEKLIEEAAKALFFRDMVDGQISQSLYSVWEFDTEPNAATGERIRERYKRRAVAYLKDELEGMGFA